jgi:pentatricopeptide repeat protein
VARSDARLGWATLATSLCKLGELEEARHALGELQRIEPGVSLEVWESLLRSIDPVAADDLIVGLELASREEA